MKKVYLYPVTANLDKVLPGSYIDRFLESFSPYYEFVNREKPSNKGILDIVNYIGKIDFVFLNWIEDLPDKRGGLIQSLFFVILTYILKIWRVRIVWTMHNKTSHYKTNANLKKYLFGFILRKSDFIITLSKEGLQCFNEYKLKNTGKIRYFPHPLKKDFIRFNNSPSTDILIWGSIIPYKGIDTFLKYLHDHRLQNNYQIRIVGKVNPTEYETIIRRYCNNHIRLDNRYVPEEELKNIMADSKVVLFTYIGKSVLSSGALMDTLSYGVDILAPHVGAFKDAAEDKLINTFENYDDLIPLLTRIMNAPLHANLSIIEHFIEENNWGQFAPKITNWIH